MDTVIGVFAFVARFFAFLLAAALAAAIGIVCYYEIQIGLYYINEVDLNLYYYFWLAFLAVVLVGLVCLAVWIFFAGLFYWLFGE